MDLIAERFCWVLKPPFLYRQLGDSLRCLCDGDQGHVDGGEYFLRTLNAVMTKRTVLCRIRAWREEGTGSALAQRLAILDRFLGVPQSFLVCAGIVPHIRPRLLPFTPVRSSTLRSVIALSTVIHKWEVNEYVSSRLSHNLIYGACITDLRVNRFKCSLCSLGF